MISKVWTKAGRHTPQQGVLSTIAPSMVRVLSKTCQLAANRTGRAQNRNEMEHRGTIRAYCPPSSAYLWHRLNWISLPTTYFLLTPRTNTKSSWARILSRRRLKSCTTETKTSFRCCTFRPLSSRKVSLNGKLWAHQVGEFWFKNDLTLKPLVFRPFN